MTSIYIRQTLITLIFLFPFIVRAHPHSFITLNTSFYTQEDSLTKIHFVWTFDDMTSSYLLLEYKQNPKSALDDLMNNIVNNHFFSEFWLKSAFKDKPISLSQEHEQATLNFDSNKAILSFWVQLKHPIKLKNNQFELMTYEKTFYVDMYYQKNNDIQINSPSCSISITKPTPNDSLLNYAQSLDQDDTPIENDDFKLGKLFAQKVIVVCK